MNDFLNSQLEEKILSSGKFGNHKDSSNIPKVLNLAHLQYVTKVSLLKIERDS
jgi:hypothetical protein